MTQRDWHPRAFLRSLSDDVARALSRELGLALEGHGLHAAEALAHAFRTLESDRQKRIEAALSPLHELCTTLGRETLEKVAAVRWQATRPDWVALIVGFSTSDLAVRLYLEDARSLLEAHAFLTRASEQKVAIYRGKYVADVVPSFDRKARMKQLICDHFVETAPELVLEGSVFGELVEDERLSLFVCPKEEAEEIMVKGPERALNLSSTAYPIAVVFEFESGLLQVKAPTKRDRESLRHAFARVFAGDPSYFEDEEMDRNEAASFDAEGLTPGLGGEQITDVQVDRVTVRKAEHDATRLTLEFESGLTLDRAVLALRSHGVRLMNDNVEGAGLVVHFAGGGRSRKRSILLERLVRDPRPRNRRERVIQRYLRAWNLDADRRNPLLAAALRTPPCTRDAL